MDSYKESINIHMPKATHENLDFRSNGRRRKMAPGKKAGDFYIKFHIFSFHITCH